MESETSEGEERRKKEGIPAHADVQYGEGGHSGRALRKSAQGRD